MSLTIEALVTDPLVRTRIVAGRAGMQRSITWAHTCEVSDPWNWLGSGDLLMTDGYSFPADPAAQVHFIRQLADASIVGLALGEGFVAPPLTTEAISAADSMGFPVLMTVRSVPFVTVARLVAEANSGRAHSRAARVLRLYDILRRTHQGASADDLLERLGRELHAHLHVISLRTGRSLLPGPTELPPGVKEAALERAKAQDGRLSAFNRLTAADVSALLVPIGTQGTAGLVVRDQPGEETPDLLLTQHAGMIVELEVERRAAQASRLRARGADIARRMLDGTIAPEAAAKQMRLHGLGDGPWRVTVWRESSEGNPGRVHSIRLAEGLEYASWPHLHLPVGELHLIVVDDDRFLAGLELDFAEATVGASQPVASLARLSDAFREAQWALESARAGSVQSAVYGTHGSYFMPNTVAEGEAAVQRLLGPIIEYDEAHGANLLGSLQVYFEVNRSWQEGARRLGIHKQTLVYRLKKVEEMTGADLRDFGVQAELYLALRTRQLLNTAVDDGTIVG
ncbi:PucR family transcriptional regulator [Nocardioides sp. CN2-186]|uniref:PucR family transcriptional regulator n=1 Tax=Nocardioides tweenelious TaxID=3156607 RepID=UPI0032B3832B